jgi:hypothetical protein
MRKEGAEFPGGCMTFRSQSGPFCRLAFAGDLARGGDRLCYEKLKTAPACIGVALRPIEQLRPPKGAPTVLVILIDDAGFGSSSAFGGTCQTPNAEMLATAGLKFNRFHTTARCSPTAPGHGAALRRFLDICLGLRWFAHAIGRRVRSASTENWAICA